MGSGEVWLGRALVVNAPVGPLRAWLTEAGDESDLLPSPPPIRRRAVVAMKVDREVVPEGMARRVIRVGNPDEPADGANVVSILLAPERNRRRVEVVASFILPEGTLPAPEHEDLAEAAVRELMPFAGDRLQRAPALLRPNWDDDQSLEDPAPGAGWPNEVDVRLLAKPPVYRLPREAVGSLGTDGDCLLGLRTADAILADLG